MSDLTVQAGGKQRVELNRVKASGSKSPAWRTIFFREVHELWIGGRAPTLLLLYSLLLGIVTYVFASNNELSLMPPKEMVYETLKTAISVSLLIGLIIGADSISGERERATLESLLLTPTSRRQIIIGKFLAALTVWPAAMIIATPYMNILAQGDEAFGQGLLWGGLLGSVLVPAFTALGMFVSFWCSSNKTSFLVNLGLYILFFLPVQLPGRAQAGAPGQFLQWINPIAAVWNFLEKILVNNRTPAERWTWLNPPIVFCLAMLLLLFLYASPGLSLEGGRPSRLRLKWGRVTGLLPIAGLLFSLSTSHVLAQAPSAGLELPLQISVDMDYKVVRAGEAVFFNTVVTNPTPEVSPPIVAAINIINIDKEGEVVDPEDWSPERTQYIEQLAPGQSTQLAWRINAILDGDFMVYIVAMPQPASRETTSQVVASPGIHLTVTPFTKLNPRGVLPYTIGWPLVIGLSLLYVQRRRRNAIDTSGS